MGTDRWRVGVDVGGTFTDVAAKAAAMQELGLQVNICGTR